MIYYRSSCLQQGVSEWRNLLKDVALKWDGLHGVCGHARVVHTRKLDILVMLIYLIMGFKYYVAWLCIRLGACMYF